MSLYQAVKILNELRGQNIINDYAIMGGYAVNYYIEPMATMDIDVLISLGNDTDLHQLFSKLTSLGYKFSGQHLIIGNTPVQFLPTYISPLYNAAMGHAQWVKLQDLRVKVITVEFLIAFLLIAFRAKDKIRVSELVKVANPDTLVEVLKKYETREVPLQRRLQEVLGYSKQG